MIKESYITKRQAGKVRSAIRAFNLIERLQSFALGKQVKEKCECGREYELFVPSQKGKNDMSPSQVRAATELINHVLPAIKEVFQHEGEQQKSPEEMWDDIATFIKEQGKVGQEEFAKRGVEVRTGKPDLRVVNND